MQRRNASLSSEDLGLVMLFLAVRLGVSDPPEPLNLIENGKSHGI